MKTSCIAAIVLGVGIVFFIFRQMIAQKSCTNAATRTITTHINKTQSLMFAGGLAVIALFSFLFKSYAIMGVAFAGMFLCYLPTLVRINSDSHRKDSRLVTKASLKTVGSAGGMVADAAALYAGQPQLIPVAHKIGEAAGGSLITVAEHMDEEDAKYGETTSQHIKKLEQKDGKLWREASDMVGARLTPNKIDDVLVVGKETINSLPKQQEYSESIIDADFREVEDNVMAQIVSAGPHLVRKGSNKTKGLPLFSDKPAEVQMAEVEAEARKTIEKVDKKQGKKSIDDFKPSQVKRKLPPPSEIPVEDEIKVSRIDEVSHNTVSDKDFLYAKTSKQQKIDITTLTPEDKEQRVRDYLTNKLRFRGVEKYTYEQLLEKIAKPGKSIQPTVKRLMDQGMDIETAVLEMVTGNIYL